jgi:hypothetical protein
MNQVVLDKHDLEIRDRFHELNREIVAESKKAQSAEFKVLKDMWEIIKGKFWEADGITGEEWRKELLRKGVKYANKSTFYHKLELIKKAICILSEDEAIRLVVERDGTLKDLEDRGVFKFSMNGEGLRKEAQLIDQNNKVVDNDARGYLLQLVGMKPAHAREKIKRDASKTEDFILWPTTPSGFYAKLVDEINSAAEYKLPNAVYILTRKLLENLIIDILRSKYGESKKELYQNTPKRFLDFDDLIKNLRNNKLDFAYISTSLDDKFFGNLNFFRVQGNTAVHSIDCDMTIASLNNIKSKLNHTVQLLWHIYERVR